LASAEDSRRTLSFSLDCLPSWLYSKPQGQHKAVRMYTDTLTVFASLRVGVLIRFFRTVVVTEENNVLNLALACILSSHVDNANKKPQRTEMECLREA